MVVDYAVQKAKSELKEAAKKLIKRVGWSYTLEFIPGIGFLIPGNILLVWKELKGDIVSPEGMLMMIIAVLAYLVTLTIGIIEFFIDLGIFTTIITWLIGGFFATWLWIRGSGLLGAKTEENGNKAGEPPDGASPSAPAQKNPAATKTNKPTTSSAPKLTNKTS